MANARDALGVDVGASSVKLVYGRRAGDGLRILCAEELPVTDEAGIRDDGRIAQHVIAEAVRRFGLRPSAVVCAVDRSAATVRTLALPSASDDELESMIRYEAESHVPFPLQTAELAHLKLPSQNGETRVVIAACPKATVAARRALLMESGVPPTEVGVTTLAAYNCLLRTDIEIRTGAHLIVDVGAETTAVAIVAGGALTSSFTLAQGSQTLTLCLARDRGIPVGQAEAEKRSQGIGLDEIGLPSDAELTSVTGWYQKLYTGLQRAVDAHSAVSETEMRSLVLIGGGALLPGLAEGLEAALKLPVRLADPLGWLEYRPPAGSLVSSPAMVTAAGLAMQGVGLAALPLDLTPAEVFETQRAKTRRGVGWVAAMLFVAFLAAATVWQVTNTAAARERLRDATEKLDRERANARGMRLTSAEVEALRGILRVANDESNNPLDLLELFSGLLPVEVWIREVSFRRGDTIAIKGAGLSSAAVAQAALALKKSQRFKDVHVTHTTAASIGGKTVYAFNIECSLKGGDTP